jgi:hypothetical protein
VELRDLSLVSASGSISPLSCFALVADGERIMGATVRGLCGALLVLVPASEIVLRESINRTATILVTAMLKFLNLVKITLLVKHCLALVLA